MSMKLREYSPGDCFVLWEKLAYSPHSEMRLNWYQRGQDQDGKIMVYHHGFIQVILEKYDPDENSIVPLTKIETDKFLVGDYLIRPRARVMPLLVCFDKYPISGEYVPVDMPSSRAQTMFGFYSNPDVNTFPPFPRDLVEQK